MRTLEERPMSNALTASDFDQLVAGADKPVLVDFWAAWCGPCRALGPVVEEVAEEMSERLDVYKCNVDEESELAQQFQIAHPLQGRQGRSHHGRQHAEGRSHKRDRSKSVRLVLSFYSSLVDHDESSVCRKPPVSGGVLAFGSCSRDGCICGRPFVLECGRR